MLFSSRSDGRNRLSLASGGSGPHDPGMEARVAKLESDVGHIQRDIAEIKLDIRDMKNVELRDIKNLIQTDFRLLFGAIIAVTIGLAGVMAKGFHWF